MAHPERTQVLLDATMCCALVHAFIHHPQLIANWGVFGGKLRFLANVLPGSLHLEFSPTDEVAVIYRAFAQAELDRLGKNTEPEEFRCRHSRQQHRSALQIVLRDLWMPTTH